MRFVLFLLLFLVSCHKSIPPPPSNPPMEVDIYVVEPQSIPMDFSLIAVIQSSHQVQIRSGVEGTLTHIAYTEGSFVKAGDLLFQIDPRRFEDALKVAQANLEKAEAILTQAQLTVDRIQPLYADKAASKKDLDDAMAQLLTSQSSLNIYKASLDAAQLDLNDTSITSPISGVTSSSSFQEGTLINPNTNTTLTTVSVLDPIWAILNISEDFFLTAAAKVTKKEWFIPHNSNFTVTLTFNNGEIFPHQGTVSFISPIFNQSTGTLMTRAVFSNPNNTLKPGQFVNAQVSGAMQLNAIIVPQEAIQQGAVGHYVYIVNEDKQAELRPVVVGDWYKEYWIIQSGLEKGDRVITTGINKLKNDTNVKMKKNK